MCVWLVHAVSNVCTPPSNTRPYPPALKRTYQLATVDADAFGDRALHAIQALYDLHAVESESVQRLAALYARLLGARWLKEQRYTLWETSAAPTAAQVRPPPWYDRCGRPRADLVRPHSSYRPSTPSTSSSAWAYATRSVSSCSTSLSGRRLCTAPRCAHAVVWQQEARCCSVLTDLRAMIRTYLAGTRRSAARRRQTRAPPCTSASPTRCSSGTTPTTSANRSATRCFRSVGSLSVVKRVQGTHKELVSCWNSSCNTSRPSTPTRAQTSCQRLRTAAS